MQGQIEALRDVGVGVIDLAFGAMGQERSLTALEVLAREVAPTIRDW